MHIYEGSTPGDVISKYIIDAKCDDIEEIDEFISATLDIVTSAGVKLNTLTAATKIKGENYFTFKDKFPIVDMYDSIESATFEVKYEIKGILKQY